MKVRFPDDAPMYAIICGGCLQPTQGGGFLTEGRTKELALEDHRKYGVCGVCHAELADVGCSIRVFDTPEFMRGKEIEVKTPFPESKEPQP